MISIFNFIYTSYTICKLPDDVYWMWHFPFSWYVPKWDIWKNIIKEMKWNHSDWSCYLQPTYIIDPFHPPKSLKHLPSCNSVTPKMEAACSSKRFASIYDPTCYQHPEEYHMIKAYMHQKYTNMQHICLSQKATNIYTGSKIK